MQWNLRQKWSWKPRLSFSMLCFGNETIIDNYCFILCCIGISPFQIGPSSRIPTNSLPHTLLFPIVSEQGEQDRKGKSYDFMLLSAEFLHAMGSETFWICFWWCLHQPVRQPIWPRFLITSQIPRTNFNSRGSNNVMKSHLRHKDARLLSGQLSSEYKSLSWTPCTSDAEDSM